MTLNEAIQRAERRRHAAERREAKSRNLERSMAAEALSLVSDFVKEARRRELPTQAVVDDVGRPVLAGWPVLRQPGPEQGVEKWTLVTENGVLVECLATSIAGKRSVILPPDTKPALPSFGPGGPVLGGRPLDDLLADYLVPNSPV